MRFLSHIFLALVFSAGFIFSQGNSVAVITLDGAINPAAADYLEWGMEKAEEENAEALIFRLNTPGGLLKSTRTMVSLMLESKIPVVVYVSPAGAQAASAGVFITMAANVAAMAPGTNIGAAHPVSLQGQQDSVMSEKATNDAAAFIRSISEKRERNIEWGEEAVRKSISITETEAVDLNVVNFIAENMRDLLEQLDGIEVTTLSGTEVLDTDNAEINYYDMKIQHKFLSILSDPNIAYILFMLGIYGLLFELYSPGAIFPGVVGVISLVLAFYSLNTLPINYAGLALIILSIILFILEIKVVSYGMLSVGGIISLILGSFMLIDVDSTLQAVAISWQLILLVAALTLVFFVFAIGYGMKAMKRQPTTGYEGIIGETGEAVSELNPNGQVRVHGEIWSAETFEETILPGSKVKVEGITNLKLKVRKI